MSESSPRQRAPTPRRATAATAGRGSARADGTRGSGGSGGRPPGLAQLADRAPAVSGLMARAARLHFEFGLTHQDTAAALGISRIKVTRLLKQARQAGIVKITVIADVSPFAELEERLAQAAGLREAIIVPAAGDSGAARSMLARGAASYLERVMRDGIVVAVGLSRTIAEMPNWLSNARPARASFVSLAGALRVGGQGSGSPYQATDALARAFGGTAEHLHAPVIVRSQAAAEELRSDPAIAQTLERAAAADMAFVGVGGREDRNQGLCITAAEWANLLDCGMVGDISGRFFDRNGLQLRHEVNGRVIALDLDEFSKVPARVLAAAGPSKVEAIAAALRGGLATVLVTDVDTAHALIRDVQ
jgi:DNA-binding transcriptional regulator LsrR (DeoR family)